MELLVGNMQTGGRWNAVHVRRQPRLSIGTTDAAQRLRQAILTARACSTDQPLGPVQRKGGERTREPRLSGRATMLPRSTPSAEIPRPRCPTKQPCPIEFAGSKCHAARGKAVIRVHQPHFRRHCGGSSHPNVLANPQNTTASPRERRPADGRKQRRRRAPLEGRSARRARAEDARPITGVRSRASNEGRQFRIKPVGSFHSDDPPLARPHGRQP